MIGVFLDDKTDRCANFRFLEILLGEGELFGVSFVLHIWK